MGLALHENLAVIDALHRHVPPKLLLLGLHVLQHRRWLLRKVQPLVGTLLDISLQSLQLFIEVVKAREADVFGINSIPILFLLQLEYLHLLLVLKIAGVEVALEHIGPVRRVQSLRKHVLNPAALQPRRSEDLRHFIEPQLHVFLQQPLQHLLQILAQVSMRRELQVVMEDVAEQLVLVSRVVRRKADD